MLKCPHCGIEVAKPFAPGTPQREPDCGDLFCCGRCGGASEFNAALELVELTPAGYHRAQVLNPQAARQLRLTSAIARASAYQRRQRVIEIARRN